MTLTVGSLFSGIGGLDLGLERAGMRVIWQSEIDPYCSRVLAHHWPDVPNLGDVTEIDWSSVERPDLICGGYPCQPFSYAGARAGTDDPRHLWPRFADALRVLRPRVALMENVPGHLSLGFGDVLSDLAELGFDAEWDCIPAAAVGAPHLRYRVFIVATNADPDRRRQQVGAQLDGTTNKGAPHRDPRGEHAHGLRDDVADSHRCRRQRWPGIFRSGGGRQSADGSWWAAEPDMGRVAHGIPRRVDRLRGLGNAVVPQVAELIGRRIVEVHG